MKTLEERRQRLSLTLLFSGLVFLFLLATMVFVALIILLLVHLGRLRKRFEGWDEFEIQSVRGLGYRAVRKQ